MVSRRQLLRSSLVAGLAVACGTSPGSERQGSAGPTGTSSPTEDAAIIEQVSVFDGQRTLGVRDVVIHDGVVAEVAAAADVGVGVERVAGAGMTLLPGFIDAHTHTVQGWWLTQALLFGVTTHLDMFTVPSFIERLRDQQQAGRADERADVLSAGYLATAPGGHGTQYGVDVPTLTDPSQADAWVADRLEEGSDWIKIIVEDRGDFQRLEPAIVEALIDAAHDRDVLTVAHAMRRPLAREVIEAGVDGLAHVFTDQPPDQQLMDLAVDNGVFLITTLSVLGSSGAHRIVLDDDRLADLLPTGHRRHLEDAGAVEPAGQDSYRVGAQVVGEWHKADLPVLAGTDVGNAGVVAGASLHAELELLVAAGLEPQEALRSATSIPADVFGLDDRGRIKTGRRADLVLVEGDPTQDITATRNIHAVWKRGRRNSPSDLADRLPR